MYETGVGIAFLCWLWSAIRIIVFANSKMSRNLKQVGLRISWVFATTKPITEADRARGSLAITLRYLVVLAVGLPFVLLSWGYVAYAAGLFLYQRLKDFGRPASVREFGWKMKNLDLTFEQVASEMYKMNADLGMERRPFDDFRNDLWESSRASPSS